MSGFEGRLLTGVRIAVLAPEPAPTAGRILEVLGATVVGEVGTADVVLVGPGFEPSEAPDAVRIWVSPFGRTGPRASWRASDLGVHAASGNLWATGDPDRPPVRCAEPVAYAHAAPEIAFAALTALASERRPLDVDVSMQEAVCVSNMGSAGRFARSGERGKRRGANVGRTREIWPCADGWVSFGIRGGKARAASMETIAALAGIEPRDWVGFSNVTAGADELAEIEEKLAAFFAGQTMTELYDLACETNVMLAPINSPREIYASAQLAARDFFSPDGSPRTFVHARSGDGYRPQATASTPQTEGGAWAGTRILELGAGAAGPIATRYFAEHGATVVRIESRSRPDFLRAMAVGARSPHGLEGSDLFDALNCGKQSITLNLKHPEGNALARRLIVEWADAVSENFAPRAMTAFGLAYDDVVGERPDLVMLSACLNGQTGPHKDYPGFGGQGAALSGYNWLTGWPDRAPVGPFGTITDSLAPRFAATALAAALLHRRRTGEGAYLDVSQVEAAIWSLTPWLLRFRREGVVGGRLGNANPAARTHGVYACDGVDRWVAIAAWADPDVAALEAVLGGASLDEWTASRSPLEAAETLQAAGVEAVPVQDFGDVFADPQLAHRAHFEPLDHAVLGPGAYERNGFRLDGVPAGYGRPSPTLGEHTESILTGILDLSPADITRLTDTGALD